MKKIKITEMLLMVDLRREFIILSGFLEIEAILRMIQNL